MKVTRGDRSETGRDPDRFAVAIRSLLAILRSDRLTDRVARVEAEKLATRTMIALSETVEAEQAEAFEPAVGAFEKLKDELAPLNRFGDMAIEFFPPPATGRAVPAPIARAARAAVRNALLVQLDAGNVTRERIEWSCDGTNLLVDMHDDGPGQVRREDDALRPVAEQVESAGGTWDLDSTPGWGSHLQIVFPLDPPAPAAEAALEDLTPRQRQVVTLIAQGRTNPEVAEQLEISANTVKFHVRQAMRHLGVSRRSELAALAASGGPLP